MPPAILCRFTKPIFQEREITMFDKLHEECGVLGVYDNGDIGDVVSTCYMGLFALQHRGQESCGIVVNDDGIFTSHKASGLVNDGFTEDDLRALGKGQIAVAHCRYSTASDEARDLGFGAGMGLPNMKRNADGFSIESEVGKGTRIEMVFGLK